MPQVTHTKLFNLFYSKVFSCNTQFETEFRNDITHVSEQAMLLKYAWKTFLNFSQWRFLQECNSFVGFSSKISGGGVAPASKIGEMVIASSV